MALSIGGAYFAGRYSVISRGYENGSQNKSTPTTTERNPIIQGEWMMNGWAYIVWLNRDGSGVAKINPESSGSVPFGNEEKTFHWESSQESIVISEVSGNPKMWPFSNGVYPYSYESNNFVPGAASIYFTSEDGQNHWELERRR